MRSGRIERAAIKITLGWAARGKGAAFQKQDVRTDHQEPRTKNQVSFRLEPRV